MDHSAAYDAGHAAGAIIGYVLIYGGIIALGVFVGNRLARKRDTRFVRWPLLIAFGLVLLLLAGQCANPGRAQAALRGVQT
ncbi:hypothetical protein [Sphingomonas sp. KR3-1]|uniref:hypothetical protein n=1 Tax=Sphingomonas sp. KR3-1 TaxID=3156611 RepID=UPI0032B4BB74